MITIAARLCRSPRARRSASQKISSGTMTVPAADPEQAAEDAAAVPITSQLQQAIARHGRRY